VWTQRLESGRSEDRAAARQALRHWRRDEDLTGIRCAAELDSLSAKEHAACQNLWAEVATLLRRTEEKPTSPPTLQTEKKPASRRFEAEALMVLAAYQCKPSIQAMEFWGKNLWSGGKQVFYLSENGGWVEFEIPVDADGTYQLELRGTQAPDYGILQATVDGKPLDEVIDAYGPRVQPMKPVRLGPFPLKAGGHRLRLTVVGKNKVSTNHYFGIDTLELVPVPKRN
jgi:hypothetical protein